MKTEPMEALKFLYSVEDPTDNIPMHLTPKDKADHVCRLAFKEGQSSPKIKQLEWVNRFEFSEELGIKAQTPFCTYTIIDMKDSGFAEGIYLSSIDDVDVEVSSFDEGKKLAQEDFERRIKECLITE